MLPCANGMGLEWQLQLCLVCQWCLCCCKTSGLQLLGSRRCARSPKCSWRCLISYVLPVRCAALRPRQVYQASMDAVPARQASNAVLMQSMSMGPEIAPGSGVPLASSPGSPGFAMGLAVPGLTVPWGHAGYLWLATAASIAVHEVCPCGLLLA